jgi:hypothetical protein
VSGLAEYQYSYQVSPIILVGGIAGTGMLPIVSLLSPQAFPSGLLSSATADQIADYFGAFKVLPGHTLMDNEAATYPVANQAVAANAIITNPLRVSLEMLVPAGGAVTVSNKLSIITQLKGSLDNHTAQGGWYNVSTPSYIYQGCLLTSLKDTSDEAEGAQVQVRWQWDFMQPLLTVAAAQAAQNQGMSRIAQVLPNSGDPPGSQGITIGVSDPAANIVQNLVPAAASPIGSNVAPGSFPTGVVGLTAVSPIAPGS